MSKIDIIVKVQNLDGTWTEIKGLGANQTITYPDNIQPDTKKKWKAGDISDRTVLEFLAQHQQVYCSHGPGYGALPTVQEAMPIGTPKKVQLAKMRALYKRGLVDGCPCGCRGDWAITDKGLDFIGQTKLSF